MTDFLYICVLFSGFINTYMYIWCYVQNLS